MVLMLTVDVLNFKKDSFFRTVRVRMDSMPPVSLWSYHLSKELKNLLLRRTGRGCSFRYSLDIYFYLDLVWRMQLMIIKG